MNGSLRFLPHAHMLFLPQISTHPYLHTHTHTHTHTQGYVVSRCQVRISKNYDEPGILWNDFI